MDCTRLSELLINTDLGQRYDSALARCAFPVSQNRGLVVLTVAAFLIGCEVQKLRH